MTNVINIFTKEPVPAETKLEALMEVLAEFGLEVRPEIHVPGKGGLYSVWVLSDCGITFKVVVPQSADPRGVTLEELEGLPWAIADEMDRDAKEALKRAIEDFEKP